MNKQANIKVNMWILVTNKTATMFDNSSLVAVPGFGFFLPEIASQLTELSKVIDNFHIFNILHFVIIGKKIGFE